MGNRPGEFSRQSTFGFYRTLKIPNGRSSLRERPYYHYHYHYHYHSQRALMAPPQGVPIEYVFLEHVTNRTDGVLQHGFTHPLPRVSVTLCWCYSTRKQAQ